MDSVLKHSQKNQTKSLLITFDVHPRLVNGHEFKGYITERGKKISLLKDSGLNYIWYLPFKELNRKSPKMFIDYVGTHFDLNMIIVGEGFRFGHNAQGTVDDLKNLVKKKGLRYVNLNEKHLKKNL